MRHTWLFAAALGALACSDSTGGSGTGILRVQLKDAPFPYDSVQKVDIFVVRVDARLAAADSGVAATAVSDDSASVGGWTTIARPNQKFDLLTLRGGAVAALGQDTIPAGNYNGFRLVIDPSQSSITLKGGMILSGTSTPSVTFPSASRTGIKVNLTQGIPVGEDSTSTMVLDFDLDNSFVLRGNSLSQTGLLFKPVVHATAVTSP